MLPLAKNKLWLTLKRDPALLVLLFMAAAYFVFYYLTDPFKPSGTFIGWFSYTDQSSYLNIAHILAKFDFRQFHVIYNRFGVYTNYSYGLGYPLVAVPFIWLGFDKDPFVFFNLFAFILITYATYRAAKKFISPLAALLAGFGLVFATPLIHYVDQPWNSTVCLVAIAGVLIASTVKKVNRWHFLVLGLLIGWVFSARYVDAAFIGILALASLHRGSWSALLKKLIYMLIGISIFVAPVLYSQYKVFGSPFRTPYFTHNESGVSGSDEGLKAYNPSRIPTNAYGMLISPEQGTQRNDSRGLLVDMFWVLASIPGAYILLRKTNRKLFFSTLIIVSIVTSLFYLSFRGINPGSVQYGLLHYFDFLWPGAVILSAAFFDKLFNKNALIKAGRDS